MGPLHAVLVGDAAWRLAVAATGAGIGIFALAQFYRAATGARDRSVDLTHSRLRRPIHLIGPLGYAAPGVTFGLVGALLLDAAWRYDATKSKVIAGALSTVRDLPYRPWSLGAVALGLIVYGIFQIAEAPFRVLRGV